MLNAVRKFGSFVLLRLGYGGLSWLAAKIAGYKPYLRLNSPLQFLFSVKNRIGYPLFPAIYQLAARNGFEFRLPDCDKSKKVRTIVLAFSFCIPSKACFC